MNRISRKLIVSGLLTALALPMTATAANNAKGHEGADRQAGLDKILASWHLSDAQKEKLEALKQQQMESRKQLKEQKFDSREARRDAIQAQHEQGKAALAEILDENQVKVLEAYWAAGKPMHGKHMGKHDEKRHAEGKPTDERGGKHMDGERGGKHMADNGKQRMQLMGALFDSWNLDDDQRSALKDSFDAMRDEMTSLKDQDFDSREARKAAFDDLRKTQHERLAKVLNEDQIKVLDLMHQRDKRGPKMADRQQREGMKALLASWNLSDDQMQALKEVRKEMRDEMHDSMKEMHDDMREAMQDADSREERIAARQEMRKEMKEQRLELRQEGREKLADVLSAEQLDALEAFMANGMRHHAGKPHGGMKDGDMQRGPMHDADQSADA